MFDWKGFENREFCVNFENDADKIHFLKECEKRGYLWEEGQKPTQYKCTRNLGVSNLNGNKRISNNHGNRKKIVYTPHTIDCSIAENYIMERNRIRNENCGISNEIYGAELNENSELAIEIVQKWSDEHPREKVVTYLDKLLEAFPNTKITSDGTPGICPNELGLKASCTAPCRECWGRPYKENNNG